MKRIEKARTPESDTPAVVGQEFCGANPARNAKAFAGRGDRHDLANTASHLHLDVTLSIPEKGEILAEAYVSQAKRITGYAERIAGSNILSRGYRERYQRFAQAQVRIARDLTRASKRAQNT